MYIMPPFELWFIIICTALSGLGFVAWKRSDWFNFLIKVILFVLTLWGLILLYDQHLF